MIFSELFGTAKPIIGMVHLPPLPDSPLWKGDQIDVILDFALADAINLAKGGVHGLVIENQNDYPFHLTSVPLITVTYMTILTQEISKKVNIPIGVNVLFNDWKAELAIAAACRAQFIRVEVLVDSCWSDMGFIPASAPELLRMREILPNRVLLFSDIHGKYTNLPVTKSIVESAQDAEARGLADALIVTGEETGKSVPFENLRIVKENVNIPVLAGSGVSSENIHDILSVSDGVIIGSHFKISGKLQNPVDLERVQNLIKLVK